MVIPNETLVCPVCGSTHVERWDCCSKYIWTGKRFVTYIVGRTRWYMCKSCRKHTEWDTLFDKDGKILCIENMLQTKLVHINGVNYGNNPPQ